jgi:chlorophyll synthase
VYDLSIDLLSNPKRPLAQALVPPTSYLVLSFALGILALIMGFSLGGMSFLLTLLALIGSWAYSAPPLRLRQRLFSTLVIGWGSCLAFLIGYFSRTRLRDISLDKRTLFLSLTIFAALSLGPLTKDLKDYQGDLRAGVRTFFTAFGLSKGKKIVSFLLGLSLLTPLLLFHEPLDIVVLTGIAAASSLLFYYREKLIFSQLGYGLAILYCALRIMHFI